MPPLSRANGVVHLRNEGEEMRMAEEQMTGGCACGRVRFTATIRDDEAYLCHCRMCQRATGSVSIAFKNVKQADVSWDSGPDWYDSSPIARRPFCRSAAPRSASSSRRTATTST